MRFQNVDTLRLAMAASVLFSHSFLLAQGNERQEPFVQLLGPGNILGLYGVFGFMIISGFLVTRSFRGRAAWWSYLASRVLRIFPALVVVSLACAFVIGPIVTTLPLGDYFTSKQTYAFVVKSSALTNYGLDPLPGVSFSDAKTGRVVLGTLWTLRPEVVCYLLVLLAGLVGLLRLPLLLAAVAVGLWSHTGAPSSLSAVGYLAPYFAAGAALCLVHERRRPGSITLALAGIGLLATAALGAAHEGFAVFGSILLVQLATTSRVSLGRGARFGDLSYGIYLIGWPVQQLLVWVTDGAITWLALFAASLTISAALAWLSWRLVEARAIELGRAIRRRAAARAGARQPKRLAST